jgi:hypothetical protein
LRFEISVIPADGVMSLDDCCETFQDGVAVYFKVKNALEDGTTKLYPNFWAQSCDAVPHHKRTEIQATRLQMPKNWQLTRWFV